MSREQRETPIYLRYKQRVAEAKATIDANKKAMEAKIAQQKIDPAATGTTPTSTNTEPPKRGCNCGKKKA